ncbi:hypothetical protein DIPPA_25520 [Diplonema papillatum]|nr:hypothetical protein DIPPA_25520 [Diplonema papillatum]
MSPSITMASSVFFPKLSGTPPYPTVESHCNASHRLHPATSASTVASPRPSCITCAAASVAAVIGPPHVDHHPPRRSRRERRR